MTTRTKIAVSLPAGVVGQVWRDGRRQANLARRHGIATSDPDDMRRLDPAVMLVPV